MPGKDGKVLDYGEVFGDSRYCSQKEVVHSVLQEILYVWYNEGNIAKNCILEVNYDFVY